MIPNKKENLRINVFDSVVTAIYYHFKLDSEPMETNSSLMEFSPRLQKHSGWLSLANTFAFLFIGICIEIFPKQVLTLLLDFRFSNFPHSDDAQLPDEEILQAIARMIGGLLLAQSTTCVLLLLPLLRSSMGDLTHLSIGLSRASIVIQGITGLSWLIVGLINDRTNESGEEDRRDKLGLLVVGFTVLILSCISLMLSFWPMDPSSNITIFEESSSQRTSSIEEGHEESEALRAEDGAICGRYHLLGDGETDELEHDRNGNGIATYADFIIQEEGGDLQDIDEPTSRIRGTRRLLKLAAPQVLYLYIGCITLLVRLPFSLSIPHFVSTTLGALSEGNFDRARREIFWLFILGTIDACLDFWCIFWFGYANLRIVRGVRVDTFAAILRQEVGFFDKHTSGELASRLNSDCGEMAGGMWFLMSSFTDDPKN